METLLHQHGFFTQQTTLTYFKTYVATPFY